MHKVDILLASYNGGKFIAEQLDSILAQTFQDFRILIRDDGSTDNTQEIIEEYAKKYPDKIKIIHDKAICKSATKNFFELVKHAQADYIMFSDQDDYWLPYKIQITFDYMKQAEKENPNKPVLVFTGLEVVDEKLKSEGRILFLDGLNERFKFKYLIGGNCAAGCTQMMNRMHYSLFVNYDEAIYLHDWWSCMIASACGVIIRVPMSLMFYRQHSHNVIGYGHGINTKERLLRIIKAPFTKFRTSRKFFYDYGKMYEILYERCNKLMSEENKKILQDYIDLYGHEKRRRFKAMKRIHKYSKSSLLNNIIFTLKALFF